MHYVTAIIPTRSQDPAKLHRAIQSAQIADEVIVVIDREQDGGYDLPCSVIAARVPGIGGAINTGAANATSDRIAILGSDDEWCAGKEHQFAHPHPATFTDYSLDGVDHACDTDLGRLYTDNIMSCSTVCVDRELFWAVGGFDPFLVWAQDHEFNTKIQMANGWQRIPKVMARLHSNRGGHTLSAPNQRSAYLAEVSRRTTMRRKFPKCRE